MPLQNRVLPSGEIVAIPQRGLFTGNRGIIHDPGTKTLLSKRWTSRAWIICLCRFKDMHRDVMARRSWTELFFLDEATALAAGHRPCFYCQRETAIKFRDAWARGNGIVHIKAPDMDAVLHAERLDGRRKCLHPVNSSIHDLPGGTMVAAGGAFFTVSGGRVLRWTPDGYEADTPLQSRFELLTPPSTVRALAAGYTPVLHPTAPA